MRSLSRAALLIVLCTLLVACRHKRTFDENLAEAFSQMGVAIPAAKGAGVPVPQEAVLVFILPDRLAVEGTRDFISTVEANLPMKADAIVVAPIDPARAATTGISEKYKRTSGDPYIVPLGNMLGEHAAKGRTQASIVAPVPPPEQVFKEVRATLAAQGFKELYRIVRAPDGKLVAEKLNL